MLKDEIVASIIVGIFCGVVTGAFIGMVYVLVSSHLIGGQ